MLSNAVKFWLGFVACLVCFEVLTSRAFHWSPAQREPRSALQRFFEHGASIEAKLQRLVGANGEEPADIVKAGWSDTQPAVAPENWAEASRRVLIYGMSFSRRVGQQLAELAPGMCVVSRSAPGAPPNHSIEVALMDPLRPEASDVVIGLLSSSIPKMKSATGLFSMPEYPPPYSYPIYTRVADSTIKRSPPIASYKAFVEAFRATGESALFSDHMSFLAAHDAYFDRFTWAQWPGSELTLMKLLRRSWASRAKTITAASVYSATAGYKSEDPALAALPFMISGLQEECNARGQRFVVLLFHHRGEPGHLGRWLGPVLSKNGTRFVSSASVLDSTDPLNFLADGHYKPEWDRAIAEQLESALGGS